jgi:hypothetical protein
VREEREKRRIMKKEREDRQHEKKGVKSRKVN